MFVSIDKDKCVGCNACIRVCPVKEANEAHLAEDGLHSIVNINKDKCISCGECVKKCEHGARVYEDDTDRFFGALKGRVNITVIVAPAFRLTEPDADAMLAFLRNELNVKLIYDVSFGADICTYMHLKAVKEKVVRKIVSQPCAATTEFILKHRHDMIQSLSPVHSPISCTAVYLRKYMNITNDIACISPCIAKKFEFNETGLVQYNVTFKRFAEYIRKHYPHFDKEATFRFDNPDCYCGKIYPKPGGLKECLLHAEPSLTVRNCEGISHVYDALDYYYYNAKENERPAVFDILSCANGCISGPGTNFEEADMFRYLSAADRLSSESFEAREGQTAKSFNKTIDKQFDLFDKKLKFEDFIRDYEPKKTEEKQITEQDVKDAYTALLKTTKAEQNFNCGACGYDSCEEMANAIAMGRNVPQNCHQFNVRQAGVAVQQAVAASDAAKAQNNMIIGVIDDIVGDINMIRNDTNSIGERCEVNKTSMVAVEQKLEMLRGKCAEIDGAIQGIIHVNDLYNKMAGAIRTITEQTHILSLNASVEAARAGAAGKTFQVVAGEIRSLAANTKATTKTVEENDEVVKGETAKVLKIAEDIERMVNELAQVMEEVQENLNKTNSIGENIETVAEEITSSTDELRRMTNQ